MGKKASTSNSQVQSPTSVGSPVPRMDAPPPYDQVFSDRRSSSLSAHSTDGLQVDDRGGNRQLGGAQNSGSDAAAERAAKVARQKRDGGCMNVGQNVDGCMNVGGGFEGGRTDGCMNYGGGNLYRKYSGCMNYQSRSGCMNYQSTGGCMNYQVSDDWDGNEGCMNYKRGGGCLLSG